MVSILASVGYLLMGCSIVWVRRGFLHARPTLNCPPCEAPGFTRLWSRLRATRCRVLMRGGRSGGRSEWAGGRRASARRADGPRAQFHPQSGSQAQTNPVEGDTANDASMRPHYPFQSGSHASNPLKQASKQDKLKNKNCYSFYKCNRPFLSMHMLDHLLLLDPLLLDLLIARPHCRRR